MAKYALNNLSNKVLAAENRMALPDEKKLAAEVQKTRKMLEARHTAEFGKEAGR